ncbi:MAG TPA: MBL fold metallo-hydrolase [Geobacterales bacterium]|nr:MBL fold metallo-hydrolase [Geobacterales bacterium]
MKVIRLTGNPVVYSCNSYLLLGEWNRIEDVNTLIDPGTDGSVMAQIERLNTGVGKKGVDQVILTHNHFDHAGGVAAIKERYGCRVHAFVPGVGVDRCLHEGEQLPAGDGWLEVIHTPGHSSDSIALYCQSQGILFSGDMQLRIVAPGGIYTAAYLASLSKIANRKVSIIYSGHDHPLTSGAQEQILTTLANVRNSTIAEESI